jgi:alpha-ribazole phosphatase/probable phosphoglycerate mutase
MKLWYETHSTSTDNERGIMSGHLDVDLSETGRAQAAELGLRYAHRSVRKLYTSDLTRAVSTAQIAFAQTGIPRIADPRLRECDYGEWSGGPTRQAHGTWVNFIDAPFPNGESLRDVVRRIERFLEDLPDEGPILIIAHRAPWYAFEHLLKGRDLAEVVNSPWFWQPGWEYDLRR